MAVPQFHALGRRIEGKRHRLTRPEALRRHMVQRRGAIDRARQGRPDGRHDPGVVCGPGAGTHRPNGGEVGVDQRQLVRPGAAFAQRIAARQIAVDAVRHGHDSLPTAARNPVLLDAGLERGAVPRLII